MTDKIQIKSFYAVPSELQQKVRVLADRYFNPANRSADEKAEADDRYFDTGNEFCHILALENNDVIGLVVTLKREIEYKHKKILLGGIGGVCVREDRRRMGVASKLMDIAMKELKINNCDVVYLCTDIDKQGTEKLYSRIGFVPLIHGHTYLGKSGKRYLDHDGMIANCNSLKIFNTVLNDKEPFDIGLGNW